MILAAIIVIAAAGTAITWWYTRPPRKLTSQASQTRHDIEEWEDPFSLGNRARQIAPRTYLQGDSPDKQEIVLESEEEFRITSVAYLTGSGKAVLTQDLDLRGKRVAHAVDDQSVRAVLRIESNPWDGSGTVQLRFRVMIGDLEKEIVYVASVVPEFKLGPAGRMMEFRRVVDPRSTPVVSAMVN